MKKLLYALTLLISTSLISQEIDFGKVTKAELEQKFYPEDSTANAAYLYKYRRTYYEYINGIGLQVVNEYHSRIKIYNEKGFNKANQVISYYKPDKGENENISNLKAYTFNLENGSVKKEKLSKKGIFDEKISKYRSIKKITFPNIKNGSVIDFKYRITSPYSSSIDDVSFQYDIPVQNYFCSIEVPEWYFFKRIPKGYFKIEPVEQEKRKSVTLRNTSKELFRARGNFSKENLTYRINKYKYEAKNIPALKDDEAFVNNVNNYRGGVKFEIVMSKFPNSPIKSYSNSWEKVSKTIYQSENFGGELSKKSYFKDDLAGKIATATNEFEKIITIFQFVKQKVKWNGYLGKFADVGVKKAYKEGTGNIADINLMLTSMLREAGLNASPVLVSTRSNGVPLSPTLDGFNYVVSIVEFPDGSYVLLDASENYSEPNVLPVRALNWNGMKMGQNGSFSWVKLTHSKTAKEENSIKAKISEDGTIDGLLRRKFQNLSAQIKRKNNNHIKDEDIIAKIEEDYNIEIDNFRITNKLKMAKPYSQMLKFSSDDSVEEVNGKLYVNPLLFLSSSENPFKLKERKFPIDFASPWNDTNIISIKIPEGYNVEKLPEAQTLTLPNNLGVFKFITKQTGNEIEVQSLLQFNSAIITPEYYQALKDFYGQVVAKQNEKIVLTKA